MKVVFGVSVGHQGPWSDLTIREHLKHNFVFLTLLHIGAYCIYAKMLVGYFGVGLRFFLYLYALWEKMSHAFGYRRPTQQGT